MDRSPLAFLRQHWNKALGFEGLEDALAEGRLWLILDGLNEMPRADYDLRVGEWREFLRKYCVAGKGNRALVACRVADYGEGMDAPILTVHAMDDERIRQFLQKRNPDHAEALWTALANDRDEGRGAIYELAQTPFWLVLLSSYSGKEGLPRNRADLVDRFIHDWLDYENARPQGRVISSDLQREAFIEGMTQLAWVGLSRSQNYTFRRSEAVNFLQRSQAALKAEDILGLARDCSLVSDEETALRFRHQLLQEYFAAREMARQFMNGKNLSKLWKTPWRRWKFVYSEWTPLPPPPQTFWEEAVILAAGRMDASQAEKLTLRILDHNPPLAARCVLEAGVDLEMNETLVNEVKARLQSGLQNPRVRLPARLSAGKMLAKLGDPRLPEHEIAVADEKRIACILPDWVEIPASSFQMGTTPAQARLLRWQRASPTQDEFPSHSVYVSAFRMARHPVTVAEYRCFMEAGGYENDEYWKEAGALRWRNAPLPFEESYRYQYIRTLRENKEAILEQVETWVKQGSWSPAQAESVRETMNSDDDSLQRQWENYEKEKRGEDGKVIQPWLWDNKQFAVSNQPVIGVSWYEACAYAAWLTDILRREGTISKGEFIRLPTEAEWEKAARGNTGRLWTWGNLWNSRHANTLEGRVMQPSTVGAYPKNKSPYGVEDMIGSVWEWCLDWYNENEYQERQGKEVKDPCRVDGGDARVLRGGSWGNDRDDARCSFRSGFDPDRFINGIGFRLVCSPSFPSLNSESLHSESLSR